MIDSEKIKNKYENVQLLFEEALNNSQQINLFGDEENLELTVVQNKLKEMNEDFKNEIKKLEDSSEWEKYCIAFFGETNAGKSTIIESLRIIYDEETRRNEKINQILEYKSFFKDHCVEYGALIDSIRELNYLLEKNKKKVLIKKILAAFTFLVLGIIIGVTI